MQDPEVVCAGRSGSDAYKGARCVAVDRGRFAADVALGPMGPLVVVKGKGDHSSRSCVQEMGDGGWWSGGEEA